MSGAADSVRLLRRLWKPHKERLHDENPEHPTNVRFHRACSWLQRAEQASEAGDLDTALLYRWVAFNALYGQWDQLEREPVPDMVCWRHFVDRMLSLDQTGFIAATLATHKALALAIFDDEHVSRHFWQDPSEQRAGQARRTRFNAQSWYLEGAWTLIVDRSIERIYLLRCQLVHGAATYNSALNRTALRRCCLLLDHLLRAFLLVWIHHGADEDWGIMCYPPLRSSTAVARLRAPTRP